MQITINGERRDVPSGSTVGTLLAQLAVTGRIAIEVNECVVRRTEHERHALRDGDVVEIVRAIGGG